MSLMKISGFLCPSLIATGIFLAYRLTKKSRDLKKYSFPELKDKRVDYAIEYLDKHYPHLTSEPIKDGSIRYHNCSHNRIYLDHDFNNIITVVPWITSTDIFY